MAKIIRVTSALLITTLLLTALVLPVSAAELPFGDVKKTHWFYTAVERVYKNGLMKGVSEERFAPYDALTREQMAMLLYSLEGGSAKYKSYSFSDVKSGAWYADAVEWCYRNGITAGISKNKFGIGSYITRQDLVTMIYRLYRHKWEPRPDGSRDVYVRESAVFNFTDHRDIASYAMPSMTFSCGVCMIVTSEPTAHISVSPILSGSGGKIKPRDVCTRAEVAEIIYKVFYINTHI